MRSAGRFLLLAVGRAVEILLLFRSRWAAEIHFLSAVGAIYKPRKDTHFSHFARSPFVLSNALNSIVGVLVYDRLLRVFEHNPFFGRKFNLLFRFIRFLLRPEVYRMSEIGRICKDCYYGLSIPNVRQRIFFWTILNILMLGNRQFNAWEHIHFLIII